MKLGYTIVCDDTSKITRDEWLALRLGGIGSSDAAASVGLSPWHSMYSLWCDKTGEIGQQPDSSFFRWRSILEQPIWEWWIGQTQAACDPSNPPLRHVMLRSKEFPFMLDNPDGWVQGVCVVEIKTSNSWAERSYEDGVPDYYVLQAMHHMIVTGERVCYMPVMFGCNEPRLFTIHYDHNIADSLIKGEVAFWDSVLRKVAPDIDGSEASMKAVRERYADNLSGSVKQADDIAGRAVKMLREMRAAEKKHTLEMNAAKALLMDIMGNNDILLSEDGERLASWKARRDGTRVFKLEDEGRGL